MLGSSVFVLRVLERGGKKWWYVGSESGDWGRCCTRFISIGWNGIIGGEVCAYWGKVLVCGNLFITWTF